ncbi:hypothetical protein HS125_12800 [bacterium]|nr:hypothetical protein [bacterium]
MILDFKSDEVDGRQLEERGEAYRPQLMYYRRAVIEAGLCAAPEPGSPSFTPAPSTACSERRSAGVPPACVGTPPPHASGA